MMTQGISASARSTSGTSTAASTAWASSAKRLGGRRPLALEGAREHRHEAGVEGALGEQPAQEVGQLEGDEEGVGERPGAEQRRRS